MDPVFMPLDGSMELGTLDHVRPMRIQFLRAILRIQFYGSPARKCSSDFDF